MLQQGAPRVRVKKKTNKRSIFLNTDSWCSRQSVFKTIGVQDSWCSRQSVFKTIGVQKQSVSDSRCSEEREERIYIFSSNIKSENE